MRLEENSKAPVFSLLATNGKEITSQSLLGQKYVLYFYPKDNTKGCSLEAHDFASNLQSFTDKGYAIFGISPDNAASHENFCEKIGINFTLLCDEDKKVATMYGAYGKKMLYGKEHLGIIRSTFLINEEGVIVKAMYNVRAKGHVQRVLALL